MRIRLAVPDAHVHEGILNSALEAVTRTNEELLANGEVPTARKAIRNGVKWQPEPPGDEHFDLASTVVKRGWGDCDDLAPYHAASLRITGEDPDATAIVIPSNRKGNWHAVVERGDGSIDDPSVDAGMHEYRAPVQPKLQGPPGRTRLAWKRVGPVWAARCDVPWQGERHAVSGHGMSPSVREAVDDAIEGACVVGDAAGVASPEDMAKLAALQALLYGAHPDEVQAELRKQGVVGSFFGKLLKTATSIVPIPGVKQAYDLAEQGAGLFKGHGGGGKKGPPIGPHSTSSAVPSFVPPPNARGHRGGNQGPPIIMPIVRF